MRHLRVNLNDVANWLRSLPQETQFNMNTNDQCLFACYLQTVYSTKTISVGTDRATLDGERYALDPAASRIIWELWDYELPDEAWIVSRDEALSAVEKSLHLRERYRQYAQAANQRRMHVS